MEIDQKTKISLFTALGVLPFLISGIVWLVNVDNKATAASLETASIRSMLGEIRDKLIRIEEHLKRGK